MEHETNTNTGVTGLSAQEMDEDESGFSGSFGIGAIFALFVPWAWFANGFEGLPAPLRNAFGHAVFLSFAAIVVFPEIRWYVTALPAAASGFSILAPIYLTSERAIDAKIGSDSQTWRDRSFFFAVVSVPLAIIAYLR